MHIVPDAKTSLPFSIEGVGPQRTRLAGMVKPGVTEFLGGMASGKSHGIAALCAAAGAAIGDEWLEVTHGLDVGRVRLGPVELVIEAGEMPETETAGMGAPPEAIDVSPLSVLFDPSGKSAGTNRKRRIEAFTQISRLAPTRERLAKLCAGDESLLEWIVDQVASREGKAKIGDLEKAMRVIAAEAHRLKRDEHQAKVDAAKGKRQGLEGNVSELTREVAQLYGLDVETDQGQQEAEAVLLADFGEEPLLVGFRLGDSPDARRLGLFLGLDDGPGLNASAAGLALGRLQAKADARAEFDERVAALEDIDGVIDLGPAEEALKTAVASRDSAHEDASAQRSVLSAASATAQAAEDRVDESEKEAAASATDAARATQRVKDLRKTLERAESELAFIVDRRDKDLSIFEQHSAEHESARAEERATAAAYDRASAEHQGAEKSLRFAQAELDRLQLLASEQGERQRLLTTDPESIGPDQETLERAEDAVAKLDHDAAVYRLRSRFAELDVQYRSALEDEKREEAAAAVLRNIATGAHRRLYKILTKEAEIDGVEITGDGDILIVDEDPETGEERKRDVADAAHVSEGERMVCFLTMAGPYLRSIGVPVIHLEGKYWRGLGENQKRLFGRLAAERGQCILTEVVTHDGDSRPCSVETGELIMKEAEPGVWVAKAETPKGHPAFGKTFESKVFYRHLGEEPAT